MSEFATVTLLTTLLFSVIAWRRLRWLWRQQPPTRSGIARSLSVGLPSMLVLALVAAEVRIGPTPVDAMFLAGVIWPLAFLVTLFLVVRFYARPAPPRP